MNKVGHMQLAELIGRAIARQRLRSRLTQEEVAERLEIGSEAVSRIERGIVIPNIARLLEFASIFECEAADLLTESSSRPVDQATYISQLLASISHADRQLVVEMVERLSERLKHRAPAPYSKNEIPESAGRSSPSPYNVSRPASISSQ